MDQQITSIYRALQVTIQPSSTQYLLINPLLYASLCYKQLDYMNGQNTETFTLRELTFHWCQDNN